jgi:hypothetical protein
MAELLAQLTRLTEGQGVVFDLRGYPREVGPGLLQHLMGVPAHSPIWQVPLLQLPDGSQREFLFSRWLLLPEEPRLPERVAFLVDGRTISYAESLAATIERNRLGVLVGGPTAGANGNVVRVELPGGALMTFTGMRVATHNGGQHHIVGVPPTVAATPTRAGITAGRDEVLDAAIEVLRLRMR